ncbi:hypothetical protein BDK51DRAFT_52300, partial [Blyttiomyces helicus]
MEAQLVKHRKVTTKKKKKDRTRDRERDPDADDLTEPSASATTPLPPPSADAVPEEEPVDVYDADDVEVEPSLADLTALRLPAYDAPAPVYPALSQLVPSAPQALPVTFEASAPPGLDAHALYSNTSIYPDAGSLPVSAVSQTPDHAAAYAPGFQGEVEESLYPSAPLLLESTLVPTAPPIHQQLAYPLAPAVQQIPEASAIQVPLPLTDELIDRIYENPHQAEHAKVVEEFRHSASNLESSDPFYERVVEYELTFAASQREKLNLNALKARIQQTAARLWTLKKNTETVEATCEDGRKLTHTFTSETAAYNDDAVPDLEASLELIRDEAHGNLTARLFQSKLAKLWIQNFLDDFLSRSFVPPADTLSVETKTRLMHYVDVLFHFEKRSNAARASDSVDPLSQTPAVDEVNYTAFIRDVRGWITHLLSALLKHADPLDHRFILLHVLRTPGIGAWGAGFIQWPIPTVWSDDHLDHYLVALAALLGPVEEKEEELESRELDYAHLREMLKKLEESDWVVVDDSETSRRKHSPAFLLEDDYIAVMEQMSIVGMFHFFLNAYTSSYTDEMRATLHESADQRLLRLFAISTRFLKIITGAFKIFSPREFPRFLRRLGQILTDTTRIFTDLLADLNRWSYDPYGSVNSSGRGAVRMGSVATTIAAEIDGYIYRTAVSLIGAPAIGVWQYLPAIPLQRLSAPMRWTLLYGIVSGHAVPLGEDLRRRHPWAKAEVLAALADEDHAVADGLAAFLLANAA